MKTRYFSILIVLTTAFAIPLIASRCSGGKKTTENDPPQEILTNASAAGPMISVSFKKGESHNHPLMAIWTEDESGKYIETLYVAESIGKGIFQHGVKSGGQWMPGEVRRPAALPYWGHKRGIKAGDGYFLPTPDQPVADAITGPTPAGNFILKARTTVPPTGRFRVMLEINQSWDWNEYWTNTKYPDDEQYKTSSQPAVVYEALIDPTIPGQAYSMKAIGRSHYSGKDGGLYTDLETLTSALKIAGEITVQYSSPKN